MPSSLERDSQPWTDHSLDWVACGVKWAYDPLVEVIISQTARIDGDLANPFLLRHCYDIIHLNKKLRVRSIVKRSKIVFPLYKNSSSGLNKI